MFEVRYSVAKKGSFCISLYSEDYFGDKKVFWESHQARLRELWQSVKEHGFPVQVTDESDQSVTTLEDQDAFEVWITENQPFKIPD